MRISIRAGFGLMALSSAALVVAGLVLNELLKLHPCPLCIFQRLLYLVVALLALGGAVLPGWHRLWGGLTGLVAAGGVATAAYQSWLQFAPEASNECGFGEPTLIERLVDWLGMQWPDMFMATGFCSSKEWVFLGLSMANWSILCFAGFLAVAALLAVQRRR
jgi:protein dithiol:quinone oxidoreductase